jgi:hypothetical protein
MNDTNLKRLVDKNARCSSTACNFSDVVDSQMSISGVLARKTGVCVKYGQEGVPCMFGTRQIKPIHIRHEFTRGCRCIQGNSHSRNVAYLFGKCSVHATLITHTINRKVDHDFCEFRMKFLVLQNIEYALPRVVKCITN